MEQKITAGRDELGSFAPKFAQLNDDVLFGEVWAREEALSARDRSIVTVTALMARRHSGQLPEISHCQRQTPRRHRRRDGGNTHPRRLLRGMAQGLGRPAYGEGGLRGLTAGGPGISLGLLPRHGHEMTAHGPGPPTCAITSCA